MIRAEIAEIKKLFKLNNCSVTQICGCYVDGEKNIKDRWQMPFLSMDEEDLLKYMEIFKKCLSGGLGKNLINIPLQDKDVRNGLLRLRDSKLTNDEDMLEEFFLGIINTYEYVGNYLILVIHDVYDIPGKTKDGIEMVDASDEAYEYIMACICPVKLSKPGLGYDHDKGNFTHVERNWILMDPELAVLYPAFNDRSEDREAALLYAKQLRQPDKEFVSKFLKHDINMSHTEEKSTFETILEETLGKAKLHEVKEIYSNLQELVAEHAHDPEPFMLQKEDIEELLRASNISNDKLERFEKAYTGNADTGFNLNNIANMKGFTLKTKAGTIRMEPQYENVLSIRKIDGCMCAVMEIRGDIVANGIEIRAED